MRRRAEQVDHTRRRITEAAVLLHTTVGPANTSVSALAETAGVTRLTVYRHFPDEDELFAACRQHWVDANPPPDTASWRGIAGLEPRARRALRELYGWYRRHGDELFPVYRDLTVMPGTARESVREDDAAIADALVDGLPAEGTAHRTLRAAAAHVSSFWTWRSLTMEQGLSDEEAVDLAVRFLSAASR